MDMNNPKNNRELSERRRRYKYGRRMVRGKRTLIVSMNVDQDSYQYAAMRLTGKLTAIHGAFFSIPARMLLCNGFKTTYCRNSGELRTEMLLSVARRPGTKIECFGKRVSSYKCDAFKLPADAILKPC